MTKQSGVIAQNKKAYHDFEVLESLEVGLVLKGYEVKSIRQGKVALKDGYARIDRNELWLMGCHISPYLQTHSVDKIDPTRTRKLLIHKKQLKKWIGKINEKGLTLIPLKLYFKGHHVKCLIGLARSKKLYDKRRKLKERSVQRDIQVHMKRKG